MATAKNDCLLYVIDEIMINGVLENTEQGSIELINPSGWENEAVASSTGDHGTKRKRVPTSIKFKRMTDGSYKPDQYTSLDSVQVSFRDTKTGRRGRVDKATYGKHGNLGNGDSPEIELIFNNAIQWL